MHQIEKSPLIEVKNLSFSHEGRNILQNVSFSIGNGEYIGVIGPNGAGKTTLIKLLLNIYKPDEGEIRLLGKNIQEFKNWESIGYIPQRASMTSNFFPATVEEVIKTGFLHKGAKRYSPEQQEKLVEESLKNTQIEYLQYRSITELSGGERQRVLIARALLTNPKILILDEPTTAIDRTSEEHFYDFLSHLHQKGITILLISHDLDIVAQEVDKLLCVNKTVVFHENVDKTLDEKVLEAVYGTKNIRCIHHHHP